MRASQAVRPASPYKRRWLFWLGRRRPWLQLQDAGYAPRTHAWLERQDFFRFACELTGETEPLAGLLLIATHADWIVPHRDICWVSEPPQLIKTDERGRLHSASAGAAVPRRLGHLRLEGGGGARTRDRAARANHARGYRAGRGHPRPPLHDRADDAGAVHRRRGGYPDLGGRTGILWEKRWPDGDAWAAIEVVNGTPEPDGVRKHYFLQVPPNMLTARSAVAWTYGLTARQYRGLLMRT